MSTYANPFSAGKRLEVPSSAEAASRDVERALRSSSHCGLRKIRCEFDNGRATLVGEVASYYLKQVAQTIVGRLPQVKQVQNDLRVAGIEHLRTDR